jgi:OmcA/MtrC family decaheme c-type cytochrome
MPKQLRLGFFAVVIALLAACGGGGGGDRATGVEPGPPPGGNNVPPPPPVVPTNPLPAPYAEQDRLLATITDVQLNAAMAPVVRFQLTNGEGTAITDLEGGDVRFTVAKLMRSNLGSFTGTWQSYINSVETAGSVGPGTDDKLQATYEREEANLENHGDGTYTYTFAQPLDDLPQDILDQAGSEGLDLSYDGSLTHRVSMQFDGAPGKANPFYDWVPSTGQTDGVFNLNIAATESCNACHDPLAIHGGGRQEIEYCVTCHNGGSTDANSGNTVDMKVMIHKIHMGSNLASVQDGGEYAIWGFRDSKHDYSMLRYPQDIRNCVNCHAGSATGAGRDDLVLTSQGDNWADYPSGAACGSCHEAAAGHIDNHPDENCASCHSESGVAGSIVQSHVNLAAEAAEQFVAEILDVSNSGPGEFPSVTVRVHNPLNGTDYDLINDPVLAGLRVGIAWNTTDYNNVGNGQDNASSVVTGIPGAATDNGDGSFTVTASVAIPDGSSAPGVAASGSGTATIEGHPDLDVDGDSDTESIPMRNVAAHFSIDEASGMPVARRQSVELDKCLACHGSLSLHGGNRTDDIAGCVTCHNPRNTDKRVREVAMDPPTDGKHEESIDFKTMIHGIHAAAIRENALEVVGFRGFSTFRYDEEHVHYPGDLSNCTACHNSTGFLLPLADGVLGTTVDTGADRADPSDDIVVTPATAVCSSCHDGADARAHMVANGGSFATTQAAIDSGEVAESCNVCHAQGRSSGVSEVHSPR